MIDTMSRRAFLATSCAAGAAATLAAGTDGAQPTKGADARKKKLAIVTTVWRYHSHAQHMGDRFLVGYPQGGRWHEPGLEVVALYVDQTPDDDQSRQRAEMD